MSAAVACTAMAPARANAMDHVVLVLFENRSFDNLLGRLYEPGEVEAFEGVIGKDLSNPIPDWAEHGAEGGVVPYGVATGMDSPEPRPRRGVPAHQHPAVQRPRRGQPLQGRHRDGGALQRTADGRAPTMDGFVTDYISFLTVELGPAADLRRVPPDHDRLHARAGAGAQRAGPGLRRVRPLVQRGPVADDGQPVVLDGGAPRRASS